MSVSVKMDKELEALMRLRESSRRFFGLRALNDNVIQYERKSWFYKQMGLIEEEEVKSYLLSVLEEGMGLAFRSFEGLDRLLLSREIEDKSED